MRRGRVGTRAFVSASRMPNTRPVGRSSRAGERSKRGAAKETRTFCPRASFRVSCGTSRTRRGASAPTAPCSGDAIGHAVVVSQSEPNCFLRARMAPCPVCIFLHALIANPRHAPLKNKLFFPRVPSSGRSPSAAERRHHVDAGRRRPPDGRVDARRDRIGRRCVFGPPEMPHARASRPVPSLERALRSKIALCFCHTRIARSRHTEQPLTHSLRASSHHLNRRRRRCGADDSRAHGPALVRAAPVTPAQPPEPPRALGAADAGARVRGWLPGPGALAADGHAHGLPPGPVLPPGKADARPRASHAGLVQRYDGRDDGRGAISRRSVNDALYRWTTSLLARVR